VITRLILGGAQENTLHTVEDQHSFHGDEVTLITGPAEGPEGTLIPRAQNGGFRLVLMPEMVRSIRPLADWKAYRKLIALFKETQPDIVHTHSSKAGILGRAAAKKLKIPVVHSIHGAAFHYGQSKLAYRTYVAAEKWAAKSTAHFISVADAMSQAYLDEGIATPADYTTIRSGFEVEPYLNAEQSRSQTRAELGFAPEHIVIGKIARLFHLKGHEFLIQAAKRVVDSVPEARFLFVGDGILRNEFEHQIREAGLEHAFHFTGVVPPERIPSLMGAMDIVAHTSQWEGLSRVLPQGLLAGKPVVSYDVGGAREVIVNDETGFLLKRDAVDALVDALITLARDSSLRTQYGELGRQRCRQQFCHRYMTERIREVYERVL